MALLRHTHGTLTSPPPERDRSPKDKQKEASKKAGKPAVRHV